MNYKIDYKVKDIRLAPELNNIKIGGRIEKQMETFFYERVTSDFAKRIGADFYAADGMGAVHVVKEFFKK